MFCIMYPQRYKINALGGVVNSTLIKLYHWSDWWFLLLMKLYVIFPLRNAICPVDGKDVSQVY